MEELDQGETATSGESVPQTTSEAEERARSLGWVPKDEWRGDLGRWTDAETFLDKGETILPILRENNRKLERELADIRKNMQSFVEHQRKVTESEIAKRIADLKAEKREALETSDYDRTMAIDDDLAELRHQQELARKAPPAADPDVAEFVSKHSSWFGKRGDMTTDAKLFSDQFRRANPDAPVSDELAYVERKIKREYPEHFQNEPARPHTNSPVLGDSGARPVRTKGSFNDLPSDAKSEFSAFVRMGAFKDTPDDRARYAKEYFRI